MPYNWKLLEEEFSGRLLKDEPLSRHVNFRLGGPADRYLEARTSDELVQAVRLAIQAKIPWVVLGGGSNVLVSDQGFRGLVIQAAMRGWSREGLRVRAEAGVLSAFLARTTVQEGLTGITWAIGLPGTVGGAVRGNAGCFGGEMGDRVETVEVYDVERDTVRHMTAVECRFRYRDSIFKHQKQAPVILAVNLMLAPGDPVQGKKELDDVMRRRKDKQPQDASSAGCMFKNVELTGKEDLWRLRQETDIPQEFLEVRRIPVGWIIDQAGMKGIKVGGAEVSAKHANFCLNRGKATADEVVKLVALVKTNVRNRLGITLEEEVQLIGFDS